MIPVMLKIKYSKIDILYTSAPRRGQTTPLIGLPILPVYLRIHLLR